MNGSDTSAISHFVLALLAVLVLTAIWVAIAWLASGLAPTDRRVTFFWLILFMGPLAIVLAIVASPRDPAYFAPRPRPVGAGRKRFACHRCGADNDIPQNETQFSCWRCGEKMRVAAKAASTVKPASRPKPTKQQSDDAPEEAKKTLADAEASAKVARTRADELRRRAGESKDPSPSGE
jgi:hypothetical protein